MDSKDKFDAVSKKRIRREVLIKWIINGRKQI